MNDMGMEKLGFYGIASLNLTAMFTSLFASQIIQKLGARRTMLLNASLRFLWQLSLMPIACRYKAMQEGNGEIDNPFLTKKALSVINIIASIISGNAIALNWTTMAYYVNLCANDENRGRYNSIINSYYTMAFLCAMTIGGEIISRFGYVVFYSFTPAVTVLAAIVACWLPTPELVESGGKEEV